MAYDPAWADAIKSIESAGSGGYDAVGPATSSGDRAHGAYQVMGANVGPWTQAALGRSMTPEEFRADPEAQDAVFKHQFGNVAEKYGNPQDAASVWFTGRPRGGSADSASDVLGTTGSSYVDKFNKAMSDGPTAIETAMGRTRSTGSQAMAYADPNANGALNPAPPPGALSEGGTPVDTTNPKWAQILQTLGQTMTEMAPGIAQDPAHAAALEQVAAAGRPKPSTWSTNFDPITGLATQTSSDGKGTRQFKYAEPRNDPNDKVQWGIVGKDKYGQPTYGDVAKAAAAQAANPAATSTPAEADTAVSLTGQPFLEQLAKDKGTGYQTQVQSILEGRTPYPTGMLLKTPFGQQLAQDVTQADPSFETGNAMSRVKTRNEFTTGGVSSPAGQITAGNTALQHAGEMSDALEKFKGNGNDHEGLPFISYAQNKLHNASIAGTAGGSDYNNFMTAKNHFSEEVTKFYAGSAGSEGERKRALANLDEAKSLPELRSAIKEETELMNGKVGALQDRWRTGMGPLVADFPLIQKKSQDAVDRIKQRHEMSPGQTPTTASKPMKTSNGVTWSIN